jgi:proline racemase
MKMSRQENVKRIHLVSAGPLKFEAYRVRDMETQDWGPIQYHMTYGGTVLAVMGTEAAKLFIRNVKTVEALQAGEIADPSQEPLPTTHLNAYKAFRETSTAQREAAQ